MVQLHCIFLCFTDKMYSFHGEWKAGSNAGGCSDNVENYATNPQYYLNLEPGEYYKGYRCDTIFLYDENVLVFFCVMSRGYSF